MALFQTSGGSLKTVKEVKFDLERDVQRLAEQNLSSVFGLKFIKTELQLHNLRIDTLAFDEETRSFVIIEYKRDKSFSIVDQGYAYLALLLNNKADFILEYNETQKDTLKRGDVDWSQSRVFFVANSFTAHQRGAINFKDLPIELWEAKKYENGLVSFNQIKAQQTAESIKTVSKSNTVTDVSKEVKTYSVDDLFPQSKEKLRGLFDELDEYIKSLDPSISEGARKYYIGYHIDNDWRNFLYVKPYRKGITVEFARRQPKDFTDPEKRVKYKKDSMKNYSQHVSFVLVETSDDITAAAPLIRQAYQRHVAEFGK